MNTDNSGAVRDGQGLTSGHSSASRRYLTVIKILSAAWLGGLLVYFLAAPAIFLRMWPHELGELLSGWFAPLALAWVSVAVFLQWAQLRTQETEIKENSEALRMQAAELRRSVDLIEKQTENMMLESARRDREEAAAWLDRLYERLMFGAERVARTAEGCTLSNPGSREDPVRLETIIGDWRTYVERSRRHEVSRSLDGLAAGLNTLVEFVTTGWDLDISFATLQEVCRELRCIERIVAEMERVKTRPAIDNSYVWLLGDFDVRAFREQVATAYKELETLEAGLRELDELGDESH